MIQDYNPAHPEIHIEYFVVFDDGRGNGFWFPCNQDGTFPEPLNPCAQVNYNYCMENPHLFVRHGEVVKEEHLSAVPARGRCLCGNTVELVNQYCGAAQCDNCGRWYNLFGEELLPPDEWNEKCDDY